MTNNLGADLYQLLPQSRHRPVAYVFLAEQPDGRNSQGCTRGQELQPDMIVAEVMTGKPRPIHRIFPFLDALFRSSPMVVEMDDVLRSPAEVGDDEPDSRESSPRCHSTLRLPALMIPHCGLVVELVVQDYWCLRRTPDWPRHKMLDFAV